MTALRAAAAGVPAGHGHLHVEFYPPLRTAEKLKYLAGSEQGAGTLHLRHAAGGVSRNAARGDRTWRLSAAARSPPAAST